MQLNFINKLHRLYFEQRNSLKTRVTLATLCIFLSGIWIISLYSFYSLRQDLEKELGSQQLSAATIIASQIDQSVNNHLASLEYAASMVSPSLLEDPESAQLFLDNRYDLQQLFRKGYFIAKNDSVSIAFAPFNDDTVGVDYSDRDYVTTALTGFSSVGRPVIGRVTKVPIVGMAAPIKFNNRTVGVLAGVLDLTRSDFLGDIAYSSYGKTGDFLVVDKKSRIIVAASDITKIMTLMPAYGQNETIDRFISGTEGTATFTNSSRKVVASAVHILSADWVMIISMPTEEVYAPIYTLQSHILLLAMLLSVVSVIVTWVVLSFQLRPLAQVVDALSNMSGSELSLLPPVDGSTEIERVASVFNKLIVEVTDSDSKLKSSKEQYDMLVARIPIGVYILRVEMSGRYSFDYVSPRFAAMFKVPNEEMQHSPYLVFQCIHPDEYAEFVRLNTKAQQAVETFEWEGRVIIAGETRWMRFYSVPNLLPSGDSVWHGILSDITDRRTTEDALKTNMQRLNDAQSYAHIGWWELDADGVHGVWSPEIYRILGLDPSIKASPETLLSVINKDDANPTVASIQTCVTSGVEHRVEYRITRANDNHERWIDCRARAVRNSAGQIVKIAGFIQDITDRKKLEEQVAALANLDPLSGLPNRRMLTDRLTYVLAMSRRTKHYGALMFIDLDNFKTVNDSYGHQAGDQLIVEAAERIRTCVRETDTVSRFGGDEFVVLLNDLDADRNTAVTQATVLAEEIRTLLGHPYLLLNNTVQHRCTASVGITVFMNGQSTEASVVSQADTAMYRAKENGRNKIQVFNPPTVPEPSQSA